EVERRDPRHHPQRLADRVSVDPRRHLLRELPFGQVGDVAGELDHLQPPLHLPQGVRDRLAMLRRQHLRHLPTPIRDDPPKLEHDVLAAGHRHLAPLLERLPGRLDRRVDLRHGRQRHLTRDLSGRRVVDGPGALRSPVPGLSGDPMGDGSHFMSPQMTYWLVPRRRYWPWPASPRYWSSVTITRPRLKTVSTEPETRRPS